jgi:hypothetical protein
MKTKEKVKYWLNMYPDLRDNDNRLCSNIWAEELTHIEGITQATPIVEFLMLYSKNKFTSAPSIKRARAKLQEEEPKYRGEKYYLRKGTYQDKWRKDLGYENNK